MMLSDVCLSVAYIGPKLRTERPWKTKIGTEVADVTRDLTPLSRSKGLSGPAPPGRGSTAGRNLGHL